MKNQMNNRQLLKSVFWRNKHNANPNGSNTSFTRIAVIIFLSLSAFAALYADDAAMYALDQCIDYAVKQSEDIAIAELTVRNDALKLMQTKAKNSFSLHTNGGYSHIQPLDDFDATLFSLTGVTAANDSFRTGFELSTPDTKVFFSGSYLTPINPPQGQSYTMMGVSLNQTLWDGYLGFRSSGAVKQAELNFRIKELYYKKTRDDLIARIKQAYFEMVTAQRTQTFQKQILEKREEELDRTGKYFTVQKVIELDVEQAKINADLAKLDLATAENDLKVARIKLSSIIHWPLDKIYSVVEISDPPIPDLDEAHALTTAFENRIEMKELALNKIITGFEYDLNMSILSPVVSLNCGINWEREWINGINSHDWNVGISVDWALFDSGLADSQIQSTQNQIEIFKLQEVRLKQTISSEVMSSLLNVLDTNQRIDIADRTLRQMKNLYELSEKKYQKGLINRFDVMDADLKYSDAMVSLIKTRMKYQLAVLTLYRMLGL
jgi:outer membrane protein